MVRTIVTPTDQRISIEIPSAFIGQQVEVIAFTISETVDGTQDMDHILTHYAAEKALAKDWDSPEEDRAWQDL